MFNIGDFWRMILSREPELILHAYNSLPNEDEKQSVHDHLISMVTEPDWSEPQRVSAQAALEALQDNSQQN